MARPPADRAATFLCAAGRGKNSKFPARRKGLNRHIKITLAGATLSLALLFCVSCRTANPLPPADVSAPGWLVQQGQAIWHPPGHRPELAGDLLLATNVNGNFFIQLTKNP